ncbi:MAG: hypothetical protein GY820_29330 [Gammaproteobacteria bacterium]|nr:hypothetical protein [Gammaproteobacteria bacterium]
MATVSNKPLRYILQALNYSVFMGLIWYFASAPSIRVIEEDEAMLTMAFGHAGELREPCRKLSQEELNKLAPNMRKLDDCPRERSPVVIKMFFDDEPMYIVQLDPPGIYGDGGVDVYYSQTIKSGTHRLAIRMDDSVRGPGFEHLLEQTVDVVPAQILLVGFNSSSGFVVR